MLSLKELMIATKYIPYFYENLMKVAFNAKNIAKCKDKINLFCFIKYL